MEEHKHKIADADKEQNATHFTGRLCYMLVLLNALTLSSPVMSNGYTSKQSREWVDGLWVMGQMGHENRMGHMGHGSLGVDP